MPVTIAIIALIAIPAIILIQAFWVSQNRVAAFEYLFLQEIV